MTTAEFSTKKEQNIKLKPSYVLPFVLTLGSIPLLLVQPWVAGIISVFGLFLLFQTVTISLQFTQTALEVYRSENIIRSFPYSEWQNWRVFWPPLPILLYFKEVKSIHFLPIIFDPKTLKACLEERCPQN